MTHAVERAHAEVALQGRGGVALTRTDFETVRRELHAVGQRKCPWCSPARTVNTASHDGARGAPGSAMHARRVHAARRQDGCDRHEARFRWVNAETRASVERGALAYGSVILVQNGVDEESGDDVGSFLWSFSLTNPCNTRGHPAHHAQHITASAATIRAGKYYGTIEDTEDVFINAARVDAPCALASRS